METTTYESNNGNLATKVAAATLIIGSGFYFLSFIFFMNLPVFLLTFCAMVVALTMHLIMLAVVCGSLIIYPAHRRYYAGKLLQLLSPIPLVLFYMGLAWGYTLFFELS